MEAGKKRQLTSLEVGDVRSYLEDDTGRLVSQHKVVVDLVGFRSQLPIKRLPSGPLPLTLQSPILPVFQK